MKYAVLGCLVERRGYGYEVISRLQQRIPGWRLATSSVYKSLDRLEREGSIRRVHETATGRRVKVFYAATDAGERDFADWMGRAPAADPVRGEMLLKLALAGDEHVDTVCAALERLERQYLTELHRCAATADLPADPSAEVPWDQVARWLIDAATLERLNGELRWVGLALGVLRAAGPSGAVGGATLRAAAGRASA